MTFNVNTAKAAPLGLLTYDGDGPGRSSYEALKPLLLAEASSVELLSRWEGTAGRTVEEAFARVSACVTEFGAKVDGVEHLGAGSMDEDSTTLVVTGGDFTEADVGKGITVQNAHAESRWLTTTIASVTNETTVVLSTPALVATSEADVIYGTDDTTAVRAALSSGAREITIPAGIMVLDNNRQAIGNLLAAGYSSAVGIVRVPAGAVLRGAGIAATRVVSTFYDLSGDRNPNAATIVLDGDHAECRDMFIRGVMDMSGVNYSATNTNQAAPGVGVEARGVKFTVMDQLEVVEFGVSGVGIRSEIESGEGWSRRPADNNRLSNSVIDRNRNNIILIGREDNNARKPRYNTISFCRVSNSRWWRGLEARFCERNVIAFCDFDTNVGNTSDPQIVFEKGADHNLLIGTTVRNGIYGVGFTSASLPSMYNRVVGCQILNNSNTGIFFNSSHFNEIIDTTIDGSGLRAVYRFDDDLGAFLTLILEESASDTWAPDAVLSVNGNDVGEVRLYYEDAQALRVNRLAYTGGYAVGDTITDGTSSGVIKFIQTNECQSYTLRGCRIINTGGRESITPAVNAALETNIIECEFDFNSGVAIDLSGASRGRIINNRATRTIFGSSPNTANQADIRLPDGDAAVAANLEVRGNRMGLVQMQPSDALSVGGFVPAIEAGNRPQTGNAYKIARKDGAISPDGWVKVADDNGTQQKICTFPIKKFKDMGASTLNIRARVMREGAATSLRIGINATDEVWGAVTTGEWTWLEREIDLHALDGTETIRIVAWNTGSPRTWYLDGYELRPGTEDFATAAELADIANAINTTAKYPGKRVRESTNAKWVRAEGATAADDWIYEDGTTPITPT